jgi:hypothetical protein
MGMGKRGEGSGSRTVWLDLKGKEGVLTAWNRAEQKEEEFSYVFGRLTDVRVKERTYGDQVGYVVTVTLQDRDSGERYIVSSGAGSRVTCRLLGQLNAADLSHPLYIAPYLMKAGEPLGDGSTVNQDTVMTSVKHVMGVGGDRLNLSDGIRPFYNESYGDRMPAPEPILRADGKPAMQNGQPLMDRSKLEELTAELVQTLSAKIRGEVQAQAQGEAAGVDPELVAAAAGVADRRAMAARG